MTTKCPVCNKPPQPVGGVSDPGVSPCLSRCDHVHEGVRQITSDDGSVRISPTNGKGVVDLGAPMMGMTLLLSRTALAGTGTEDIPCVDSRTGNLFRPRWVHLALWRDDDRDQSSLGMSMLTDGQTVIERHCLAIDGVPNPMGGAFLGQARDNLGTTGYTVEPTASGSPTTLRLSWVAGAVAGIAVTGILRIEGIPP